MQTTPMPKVQAVPIHTKDLGWFAAVNIWLTTPRQWKLIEEYCIYIPGLGLVVIPVDFIFDGASIPRIFWFFLSPVGLLFIPGLIHDFGYQKNTLMLKKTDGQITFQVGLDKAWWDKLFRDLAIQVNGFKIINNIAWLALKIGGNGVWKRYRRNTRFGNLPEIYQNPP
jgi:hypothetical protein